MRTLTRCLVALVCASPFANAQQQWPAAGNGSYYQPPYAQRAYYQVPYNYYPGNQQPIQRVQAAYGPYGYNPMPTYPPSSYYYARPNPAMYMPGPQTGGWNLNYYPPNPILPSQSSGVVPVYASPYRGILPSRVQAPTSWPAPTATNYPLPAAEPVLETPRAPIAFHRPTRELFWFNADYTMAFIRPMRSAFPLAAVGNANDARPGSLDQPGTTVVYGNNSIDMGMFSGARIESGLFLDCNDRFSVDVCGFWMIPNTRSFYQASNPGGDPVISRPIFNVADGINREGAFLAASPGNFQGNLAIDTKSQLSGIELNGRYHSYWWERLHTDLLVGLRYLRLSESIRFKDQLVPLQNDRVPFLGGSVNPPNFLHDEDLFQTANQFFGPQIGTRARWEAPWFNLDAFAKVGLGVTEQRVNIEGSTTVTGPAGSVTVPGGILALPSNIGNYSRTVFGIVPEFGVNLGIDVTDHVRLKLGYSLLLWNHVVRPTGQIDRNVNSSNVPGSPDFGTRTGPSSPAFRYSDEIFWTQFFSIGIEAHF